METPRMPWPRLANRCPSEGGLQSLLAGTYGQLAAVASRSRCARGAFNEACLARSRPSPASKVANARKWVGCLAPGWLIALSYLHRANFMSACWNQPSRSLAAPKLKRLVGGAGSLVASAATPARCRESYPPSVPRSPKPAVPASLGMLPRIRPVRWEEERCESGFTKMPSEGA